ncbi:hypothetical protein [Actinosynnema sp. NPDC023587]|uniref:hypothetical protein n=1 Tax=Actinosynnema sp. NPDC023587 TaxID=3154695 RepID=UPI0033D72576
MVHPDGSSADRVAAARRIVDEVVNRGAFYEAVGIVAGGVGGGDPASADERFSAGYDDLRCRAEAARIAAIVDAAADGRADPDWDGR